MNIKSYILERVRGEVNLKKLLKMGLKIGSNFQYGKYCFFDPSHCFLISIGNDVTFSTRVHILAHDASTKKYLNYTKIGRVIIKDRVFIGANTTILPGVTINENSIIGAGSVVSKNVEKNSVYAGVPTKKICSIEDYLKKVSLIDSNLWFEEDYTIRGGITKEKKEEMKKMLEGGKIGFVK